MNDGISDRGERIREQREKEMGRTTGSLPRDFDTAVVGCTFVDSYPDNIYALEQAYLNAGLLGEPVACIIVRNPDNPYDANACEVHAPSLGNWAMLGHLTRPIAARLAPELDAGHIWQAHVSNVRIHPDHLENPGVDIHLTRKKAP